MKGVLVGLLAVGLLVGAPRLPAEGSITVAADISLQRSGFLAYLTSFAEAGSGISITWKALDDEQVIRLAREGRVEAIIVSSPQAEDQLMRDGAGALRLRVMIQGKDQYDAIALNPGRWSNKLATALEFLRWISSTKGQKTIAGFSPPEGVAPYNPNAGTETCTECEARQ